MVRMEVKKIPKFRKITKAERVLIAQWENQEYSNKRIAKLLGRSVSSIGREIKRNSFQGKKSSFYEPLHSQEKAEARKQRAWGAKQPLKSSKIYAYVLEKPGDGWSSEQIADKLKHYHEEDKSWWICHETIYRFVYYPDNKEKSWWEYLRRKQKKRRKRSGRKAQRIRISEGSLFIKDQRQLTGGNRLVIGEEAALLLKAILMVSIQNTRESAA